MRHKHGDKHTRLYECWCNMKARCYKPSLKCYTLYGGKGIKVCDDWLHNYPNFKEWALNNGYSDELTLDRIDTTKDYSPNNCRWATRQQQTDNRVCTKRYDVDGTMMTLGEISRKYNINHATLYYRIVLFKWDVKKAINTQHTKRYKLNGEIYTLKDLSKDFNIPRDVLYYRLERANWSIEDAIKEYGGKNG